MQNQTFIEFIASIICDEYFIKQSEEYKNGIYTKIQETYEERLDSKFQTGFHVGYLEGMKRAAEIFKGE